MTPKEFITMWLAVLGGTGLIVAWVLLCCMVWFPTSPVLAVVVSFALILSGIIGCSWFMFR